MKFNDIFDRIKYYISLYAKFMQLAKGGWSTLSTAKKFFAKHHSS